MANLMDESNETRLNQSEILLKQISTIRGIVEDIRTSYVPTWISKLKTQILDMTSYVTLLIKNYQTKQKQILEAVTADCWTKISKLTGPNTASNVFGRVAKYSKRSYHTRFRSPIGADNRNRGDILPNI